MEYIDILRPSAIYAAGKLKNRWELEGTRSAATQFLLQHISIEDEVRISYDDTERCYMVYHKEIPIGWIPKRANARYRKYFERENTLCFVESIWRNQGGRLSIQIGVCIPGA